MSQGLFSQFLPDNKSAWLCRAEDELGEKSGVLYGWNPAGNLTIEPYYTAEESDHPGLAALRAAQKSTPGWLDIADTDESSPADLISDYFATGKPYESALKAICETFYNREAAPDIKSYAVNINRFMADQTDLVEQLSLTLSVLVAYLDFFTDQNITPQDALKGGWITVFSGDQYLSEIAKLRALRFLISKIRRAYQVEDENCQPFIHVVTTLKHNPGEQHENLIRNAAQAMSAVIGGCDALTVLPYWDQDQNARRLAQNVSLILRHESNVGLTCDPAAGSYLLDNFAFQLAERAWEQFLKMEESGGIFSHIQPGKL